MSKRIQLLAGIAAISIALPAWAQDSAAASAPAADATTSATTADEADGGIIVTARRRAENLQDVPAAISVVQGEDLDRAFAELECNGERFSQFVFFFWFYFKFSINRFQLLKQLIVLKIFDHLSRENKRRSVHPHI